MILKPEELVVEETGVIGNANVKNDLSAETSSFTRDALERTNNPSTALEALSLSKDARFAVFAPDNIVAFGGYDNNLGLDGFKDEFIIRTPEELLKNAETVVLGDLHGSCLKLLESLVFADLIEITAEEAQKFKFLYGQLVNIAKIDPELEITEDTNVIDDISQFQKLQNDLLEIIAKIKWKDSSRNMILLGDTISDRGLSDILTLKLLSTIQGNLTIMASNHDCDKMFEDSKKTDELELQRIVYKHQRLSLKRAYDSSPPEEHSDLDHRYYEHLKSLKILDFNKRTKTLCSHCRLHSQTIEILRKELGFKDIDSEKDLIAFIKEINDTYCSIVVAINRKEILSEDQSRMLKLINDIVWSRSVFSDDEDELLFPKIVKNYVFGHNMRSGLHSPYINYEINETTNRIIFKDDEESDYRIFNLENNFRRHMDDAELTEMAEGSTTKFFVIMPENFRLGA